MNRTKALNNHILQTGFLLVPQNSQNYILLLVYSLFSKFQVEIQRKAGILPFFKTLNFLVLVYWEKLVEIQSLIQFFQSFCGIHFHYKNFDIITHFQSRKVQSFRLNFSRTSNLEIFQPILLSTCLWSHIGSILRQEEKLQFKTILSIYSTS